MPLIEHVWDELGSRILHRQNPPEILQELRDALVHEWHNIPQAFIQRLIGSMRRRCEAVIARGGYTRYWTPQTSILHEYFWPWLVLITMLRNCVGIAYLLCPCESKLYDFCRFFSQTVKERTSYPFCIHQPRIPSYKHRVSSNSTLYISSRSLDRLIPVIIVFSDRRQMKCMPWRRNMTAGKFGFVTKVFWQSSLVDSFDQLVSCGRRDHSDVGESYGIIHNFLAYRRRRRRPSCKERHFPLQLIFPLENSKQFPPIFRCCQTTAENTLGS